MGIRSTPYIFIGQRKMDFLTFPSDMEYLGSSFPASVFYLGFVLFSLRLYKHYYVCDSRLRTLETFCTHYLDLQDSWIKTWFYQER